MSWFMMCQVQVKPAPRESAPGWLEPRPIPRGNVLSNMGTTITHPFGNGLYHLFYGDVGDGVLLFYPHFFLVGIHWFHWSSILFRSNYSCGQKACPTALEARMLMGSVKSCTRAGGATVNVSWHGAYGKKPCAVCEFVIFSTSKLKDVSIKYYINYRQGGILVYN